MRVLLLISIFVSFCNFFIQDIFHFLIFKYLFNKREGVSFGGVRCGFNLKYFCDSYKSISFAFIVFELWLLCDVFVKQFGVAHLSGASLFLSLIRVSVFSASSSERFTDLRQKLHFTQPL